MNYGTRKVQKKINDRFINSEQFQDMMLELSIGAWHLTEKNVVTPLETDGFPDVKVILHDSNESAFIECKNIHTTDLRRIPEVITKANTQIGHTGADCYGCLALDVSIPINAGTVNDDTFPTHLAEVINIVKQALNGAENRSISSAIVIWDDNMILGKPPEKVLVAYRRRFVRIDHCNPKVVLPQTVKMFEGFTTVYNMHFTPRPQIESFRFTVNW